MDTLLITGGADGFGKAIAKRFASRYKVIITSRSKERAQKVAEELHCDGIVMDVKNFQSVERGIQYVLDTYGKIDCLINNAGIWIEGELGDNPEEKIQELIETNLLGVLYVSKAAVPSMKTKKKGLIINVNSQNGFYAKKKRSIYAASKWGITGFTKCLQDELAEYGIRVTGLYPGKMNTQLFNKVGVEKKMDDAISVEQATDAVEFVLSLPDDILIPELGIQSIRH